MYRSIWTMTKKKSENVPNACLSDVELTQCALLNSLFYHEFPFITFGYLIRNSLKRVSPQAFITQYSFL